MAMMVMPVMPSTDYSVNIAEMVIPQNIPEQHTVCIRSYIQTYRQRDVSTLVAVDDAVPALQ